MRLFDFIEEDDGIRISSDGFCQLAAFFVAYISRRSSDETGHTVFLHVFGHIDPHDMTFVIEQLFSQTLGHFGFTNTGGAQEQEGTDRTVFILNLRFGTQDGVNNQINGMILSDNPLFHFLLQVEQFLSFGFNQTADFNAGPAGDDLGDHFFVDGFLNQSVFASFIGLACGNSGFQFRNGAVAQSCGVFITGIVLSLLQIKFGFFQSLLVFLSQFNQTFFIFPLGVEFVSLFLQAAHFSLDFIAAFFGLLVIFIHQRSLLNLKKHDLTLEFIQFLRHGFHFHLQGGTGFIHQVNGLIRQKTVCDIAVAQACRGNQGIIVNMNTVIGFETVFQAAQNRNGIFYIWFADLNLLETTFQRGIFFDVLAVFVECGGTDHVQFASCQHWFKQICCVHAAFGFAGAYQVVDFINEQDNLSLAVLDFIQNGFQTLFEFAAVFSARDQAAHIQLDELLVFQGFRHIILENTPGQSFYYGSFADTGFTDEDRVVLGFTGKNFHDTADLLVTSDDGVDFAFPDISYQISAVFL